MPISESSRNVLNELIKAGVDSSVIAGLEREFENKPDTDKTASNMLLAQKSFNNYRTNKDNEIKELKEKLEQTSSLSTAANNLSGDLKAAALAQIQANKDWFEEKGYDIGEIEKLAEDMASKGIAFTTAKATEIVNKEKENVMPDNNKNYVDDKTLVDVLRTTGSNLAAGGINISAQMTRAMYEADKLGIELTDEQLDNFGTVLIKGLEENKNPREVIDAHFGFTAARQAKAEETRKAELVAAEAKGRQEALKEAGVTIRNTENRPFHPVFDRKSSTRKAIEEDCRSKAEEETKLKIEDLPKNKVGDPEFFRLRGDDSDRRERHIENASRRFAEASKQFSPDGEYIGHQANQ